MRPESIASTDPGGPRIVPEDFRIVMARISRRAQAAVAGWTPDDLSCPRIDREAVARAMSRYLALRGKPAKPLHWFAGGRSARAYMDERGARRQPLPVYWTDIRFAAALDRAWFAGAMRPPIRIDWNWEEAVLDWKMWICAVCAFNEASAADRSLDIPPDLLPIEDSLPPPAGAGKPELLLEGALLDYPLRMAPHLPAIHPERLWAPRIEAFAAGLGFFRNMPDEIICVPRPALWLADGLLHRRDGPAVLWPDGERYFFVQGEELPAVERG